MHFEHRLEESRFQIIHKDDNEGKLNLLGISPTLYYKTVRNQPFSTSFSHTMYITVEFLTPYLFSCILSKQGIKQCCYRNVINTSYCCHLKIDSFPITACPMYFIPLTIKKQKHFINDCFHLFLVTFTASHTSLFFFCFSSTLLL